MKSRKDRVGDNRRFDFIDVTLRDAHQCLWSTRMTTAMMTPVLELIDRAGYAYVNIMGGAVFDVCVRYLHENPWERIGLLCDRLATPCDGLTRAQSLYTFELFPDDIVALNSHVLARRGIDVLTVYDALNDNRNIVSSVRSGHEAGMKVNAMMTYTLSPVHTDAYYVARTRELVALAVDFISIKDPTGLLTPERGRKLFPAVVKAAGSIPVQLHSHCQSGLAPEVYEIAMQSGFRLGYTATAPLANGASLPATEDVLARARNLGFVTSMNDGVLAEIAGYFDWLCEREGKPRGKVAKYDSALYEHQIPGGMISNLRSQLQTMKLEHRLPEILEEAARVGQDLGYPIVVSPFAQYIVTQATLNVVQGKRYATIPDEIRKYARGYYGRPAATRSLGPPRATRTCCSLRSTTANYLPRFAIRFPNVVSAPRRSPSWSAFSPLAQTSNMRAFGLPAPTLPFRRRNLDCVIAAAAAILRPARPHAGNPQAIQKLPELCGND
ncbi:MAG: carboxylase [Betaproteobacteria bacterium]|nr:MAG: carboxylase [Betaproteobacteria bacterium]